MLITFVGSKDPLVWKGYLIAAGFFASTLLQGVLRQYSQGVTMIVGMRLRGIVVSAVYRKVGINNELFFYYLTLSSLVDR